MFSLVLLLLAQAPLTGARVVNASDGFMTPDAGFALVLPGKWGEVVRDPELLIIEGLGTPRTRGGDDFKVNWRRPIDNPDDHSELRALLLLPESWSVFDGSLCHCGRVKLCGPWRPNLRLEFSRGAMSVRILVCFGCNEAVVSLLDRGVEKGSQSSDLGEPDRWLAVLAPMVPADDFVAVRKQRKDGRDRRTSDRDAGQ